MSAPFSFVGAADCYVDVLTDTGESTGLELKGNCSEFVPKPDSDRKEQTATGKHNYGQVLASVVLPKPMTAKITFNQLDQGLFAAAFFGTNSAFTQAAGSITDVSVVTIPDRWVETGSLKLSDVVVKSEDGSTTYDVGTDYEITANLGMLRALSTGAIPASATVKVTGTRAAISGTKMAAMTKANVRIRVKLDGQNFADGREFVSDIHQMRLAPSSEFSFVGNEFVDVTFDGTLETPTGRTEPMTHIWLS